MEVTIVGDVVVGGFPRHPVSDSPAPGSSAFDLLHGGDLTVGNLEVPLTDRGERADKLVTMRAPRAGAQELADLGFDVVSLAMNHALDFGADGMRDTVRALDAAGVAHAGFGEDASEATRARSLEVDGQRIAFFSFCCALPAGFNATSDRAGIAAIRVRQSFEFDSGFLDETPGTPPFVHSRAHEPDVVAAERLIRAARHDHDIVIVAVHWGVPFPYLPSAQGPLAEYQRPLAHRLVKAGADVIVGHHPHCLHPIEFHEGGVILYSTGNFVFDWCDGWSPDSMTPVEQMRLSAPYQPTLVRGPWFESAVFTVRMGETGGIRVRVDPIELDADSQPLHPRPEVARAILDDLSRSSRTLDPRLGVSADGRVFAASAEAIAEVDA